MSWQERARCADSSVDPEIFYSDDSRSPGAAKKICDQCDVQLECAAAGADERYGIWGGTTPSRRAQRRKINRAAAAAAAPPKPEPAVQIRRSR